MASDIDKSIDFLRKNLRLDDNQLEEISANFEEYSKEISGLMEEFQKYKKAGEELGNLNSEAARLNYLLYETYMAVHTNSIRISGSRSAHRIAGNRFSKDVEETIQELLSRYLMIKF